ncbi:MAG: CapA family protein [Selenomonadaceae bacterium]|nr:CapA family protein [Selenomonadaceae bacterium]
MSFDQLVKRLKPTFLDAASQFSNQPFVLFLAASDMKVRAITRHAVANNPAAAWDAAVQSLKSALGSIKPTILRADWIRGSALTTWQEFLNLIGKTRRNYFRKGIALDRDFKLAFTETELNANTMLYKDGKDGNKNCVFRSERCDEYCRTRFGCEFPKLNANDPVVMFETVGAFVSDDEKQPLMITGTDINAGHRDVSNIDEAAFLRMARSGAAYLAGEVKPNGRFIYGHYPCTGKVVPSYNTLRHFSSIFAMLDVYETYGRMGNSKLGSAINKALKYGLKTFIQYRTLDDGTEAAYPVDFEGNEIKLGALGVTLVMLVKHSILMKTKKNLPLMEALARGIYSMQNPDGSFVHVLNSEDYSVKEPFRIVYYDGEAIFGLMRLYSITKDEKLRATSEAAFKRFIATNHWENHDHWLSYAINELTLYQPKREYFEFGINNFLDFLPFVYHRDTQFPTLMELMMAADTMLERMKKMPEMADLLARVPLDDFYAAMESRAKNLLNGYFYPEFAMFFKIPGVINGAFFIRHHAFRARTDDVEHFLSGFVAYRRYLAHRDHDPIPSQKLLEGKAEGSGIVNRRAGDEAVDADKKKSPEPVNDPIDHSNVSIERPEGRSVIFYGGDVNIGRRMHWKLVPKPFGDLKIMSDADLRIINLECVVANQGRQGIDKSEGGQYYFHARPEQLNLLTDAAIDVVLTANNHSKDYYDEALIEQNELLDRVGILHVGSGANFNEASKILYTRAGDLIVAIINTDSTMKPFAATDEIAGVFHLPIDQPELWRSTVGQLIADARRHADLVLVAPHWGNNGVKEPSEHQKTIGHLLIDLGADAVLGCHSHVLYGVENYNGRPIVYDAANFLFDIKPTLGGAFSIVASKDGVEQVIFTPLLIGRRQTLPATKAQADQIGKYMIDESRKLNTVGELINNGLIKFSFEPSARKSIELEPIEVSTARRDAEKILPLSEPLSDWIVERVPDDAVIEPQQLGLLKLVGCRIDPECMVMTRRRMLYVETYWTIDQPIEQNCNVRMLGVPTIKDAMPPFGAGMEHEGCDWLYPTDRWTPGVIYRERFGLRPPGFRDLVNVELRLEVSVVEGDGVSQPYVYPSTVKLQIPKAPTPTPLKSPDNDLVEELNVEKFKRELEAGNAVVFFMLRNFKTNASGLELSALRRATLFKKYFGCDVQLLTNEYQNDATDNLARYGPDGKLLNMYDYFQGIDRETTPEKIAQLPPIGADCLIEYRGSDMRVRRDDRLLMYCAFDPDNQKLRYINYFEDGKKIRRDTFDTLGFLSRRQELEPETGAVQSAEYYRPDGSVAIREIYEIVDKKSVPKSLELVDEHKAFDSGRKVIAHWLDRLTADRNKKYFMIADRSPEYSRFYVDAKRRDRKNIFVVHLLHNLHVLEPFDPFTSPTKRWFNFLTDSSLKSDAVMALTNRQREDIIKRYGLTNVVTLPHSLANINRVERPLDPMKVILVGRLTGQKNPDRALDVFKLVLQKVPRAHLHFYGEGPLADHLQQRINDEGLSESVVLEGFSRDMPSVFASAALLILTSDYEGAPLVIQESLYQGCPVVALDCTYGPADMIEDGVNGYLVPFADVELMADRIAQILLSPELRQRMSDNAPSSLKKFSQPAVAGMWAKLLLGMMRAREAEA